MVIRPIIADGANDPAARPVLAIGVLGGVRLSVGAAALSIRNRRARAILGVLALSGGGPLSRERLSGLLWSDVTEAQARNSLRQTLFDLREGLDAADAPDCVTGRDALALAPGRWRLDSEMLLVAIAAGDARAVQHLGADGPARLMADHDDLSPLLAEWLVAMRRAVQERLLRALERAYDDLSLPRQDRRLFAEAALRIDPLHEAACRSVMTLAAEEGETGVALRCYAALYEQMGAELDMEPSDATQALVAEIKRGRLAAAALPRAEPPAVAPHPRGMLPSIAVMPFRLWPADEPTAWLAAGVAEGVGHVLSGVESINVIARGSCIAAAERGGAEAADPRALGRLLGVRYVLSGSVQQDQGRLRVTTELAECDGGTSVRTDRHETRLEGLFDLQDRIAGEVVAAIAPAVRQHELARAMRCPPDSLGAYELLLRGQDLLFRLDPETFDTARALLLRGAAEDPGFAALPAHLATWHMLRIGQGWSPEIDADAAAAAQQAEAALAQEPENAIALAIKGQVLSFTRRAYAEALRLLDRAIANGPNSHLAFTLRAATRSWVGDAAGAIADAERGLRISPLDRFSFFTRHMLSQGHYMAGDFAAAVDAARAAEADNPRLTSNLRTLCAALVALGREAEARQAAARMLAIEPDFRLTRFVKRTPITEPARTAYCARLRVAGLPT